MQQIRAKNAIVKANAATVHTIIQGNLADTDYTDAVAWPVAQGAVAAVQDIRTDLGALLPVTGGTNLLRPAGMNNPHLTGDDNLVVQAIATTYDDAADFVTAAELLEPAAPFDDYAGVIIVAEDAAVPNKFYVVGLDNESDALGEVYIAMK